ncbi:type 4a pilus biogenesis protein PilO [Conchiformibius steedae]|uniref:type 4a pilus biogenesis protein PilO n=1 Tax=Conchiformibius steedae TaxID=153493 RepID=UPI0026F24980|nr:type 4a pilus biogenesis protein PilO [Conchiformibius steedae]
MNMNELDMQKLHLAPKPVQFFIALLVAALLVVAGFVLMFQEQWENLQTAQSEEVTLKEQYVDQSRQAANLENLQIELKMIEESIANLIKKLPTSSEIPSLIQELYQAAAQNGLTMSAVIPRQPVSEDSSIQRLPFTITVVGSYEQLAQFLRDVGKMSRIVTLSGITINEAPGEQAKKTGNKLQLSAVASTYKAIDAAPESAASAASGAASSAQ